MVVLKALFYFCTYPILCLENFGLINSGAHPERDLESQVVRELTAPVQSEKTKAESRETWWPQGHKDRAGSAHHHPPRTLGTGSFYISKRNHQVTQWLIILWELLPKEMFQLENKNTLKKIMTLTVTNYCGIPEMPHRKQFFFALPNCP